MTVYILGGGPAGLAVADGLTDANGGAFVLYERAERLGGLAQTVHWPGAGDHDLGPHKIFSLDRELVQRVERLLPGDAWLTREKLSRIYMNGRYLPYPPSPFSLAGVFGMSTFVRMVFGYGLARMRGLLAPTHPQTFAEDLRGRLGAPLYDVLFRPIAEKLWGNPEELDVKLSRGRVQTPALAEVLGRMLKIRASSDFEAMSFRYPRGGLGKLWEAIAGKCQGQGQICMGRAITGLEAVGNRLARIHFAGEASVTLAPGDFVIGTLPLAQTARLLGNALPEGLAGLAEERLWLNDLLLVFFHLDCPSLLPESWVFVPDPAIAFHRLSEQESFDPAMTPAGTIVCCEIMSSPDRDFGSRSDEELAAAALDGLEKMGYHGFEVRGSKVLRLRKSYPVFRQGYEEHLRVLLKALDAFENFRTIGRQGAYNYIGTLDAMDIGYGTASWLAGGRNGAWQEERNRTSHYPVLD